MTLDTGTLKQMTTKSMTDTTKKPKIEHDHRDKLGTKISVGAYVAYPNNNSMDVGIVKNLNPKMISITRTGGITYYRNTINKYPNDCVIVDGAKVTMYLIKNSK